MRKCLLIAAVIVLFSARPSIAQSTFRDVPEKRWAADAIKRLAEAGIIEGRPVSMDTLDASEQNLETSSQVVPKVKMALLAEVSLNDCIIDVDAAMRHGKKTLILRGKTYTRAQKILVQTIATNTAIGWEIFNFLCCEE